MLQKTRDLVKTRRAGRAAYVTIDRPPVNAISVEIMQASAKLVRAYHDDDNA